MSPAATDANAKFVMHYKDTFPEDPVTRTFAVVPASSVNALGFSASDTSTGGGAVTRTLAVACTVLKVA